MQHEASVSTGVESECEDTFFMKLEDNSQESVIVSEQEYELEMIKSADEIEKKNFIKDLIS